ncbi:MAG: endonuclease domain-containing protein [Pirellulales bacterium]|nr:endonuclease domain-containing protein [Pirellulales bacterium]
MTIRPSKRPTETTKQRAKSLRANATEPERILWSALRGRQVGGLKFRRQHPIEPYIVDYYCAEASLVVELDGRSHDEKIEYDNQRSAKLRKLGLTIMRVPNEEVVDNLEAVCEAIQRAAFTKIGKPLL